MFNAEQSQTLLSYEVVINVNVCACKIKQSLTLDSLLNFFTVRNKGFELVGNMLNFFRCCKFEIFFACCTIKVFLFSSTDYQCISFRRL